jgi:hypothetical protein
MENRDRDLYLRGIEEGARGEARKAPAPIQARIALRGATILASVRGDDPARAHVSGNVREAAERAALTFAHGCDGRRAEARTTRAPGDGRLWAPSDRKVNGTLHRVRPTAHDDTREGARTRTAVDAAGDRLDGADRARALIARAVRDGAPRNVIRAMADRHARGLPMEAWKAPAAPARPVVGVFRAR